MVYVNADTSSVQSDTDLQPTRRSGRRSLEVDLDLPLNNAVLQDLLTDIMHHKDSWPFLRPVPRAQVITPFGCLCALKKVNRVTLSVFLSKDYRDVFNII